MPIKSQSSTNDCIVEFDPENPFEPLQCVNPSCTQCQTSQFDVLKTLIKQKLDGDQTQKMIILDWISQLKNKNQQQKVITQMIQQFQKINHDTHKISIVIFDNGVQMHLKRKNAPKNEQQQSCLDNSQKSNFQNDNDNDFSEDLDDLKLKKKLKTDQQQLKKGQLFEEKEKLMKQKQIQQQEKLKQLKELKKQQQILSQQMESMFKKQGTKKNEQFQKICDSESQIINKKTDQQIQDENFQLNENQENLKTDLKQIFHTDQKKNCKIVDQLQDQFKSVQKLQNNSQLFDSNFFDQFDNNFDKNDDDNNTDQQSQDKITNKNENLQVENFSKNTTKQTEEKQLQQDFSIPDMKYMTEEQLEEYMLQEAIRLSEQGLSLQINNFEMDQTQESQFIQYLIEQYQLSQNDNQQQQKIQQLSENLNDCSKSSFKKQIEEIQQRDNLNKQDSSDSNQSIANNIQMPNFTNKSINGNINYNQDSSLNLTETSQNYENDTGIQDSRERNNINKNKNEKKQLFEQINPQISEQQIEEIMEKCIQGIERNHEDKSIKIKFTDQLFAQHVAKTIEENKFQGQKFSVQII